MNCIGCLIFLRHIGADTIMEEQSKAKGSVGSVYLISALILGLFVLWGVLNPQSLGNLANQALGYIINSFGWFYMSVTLFFVAFIVYLAIGPYGKLKLGKSDEIPAYSFYAWVGMLFSAGIGVGFVFWGVAEPVLYYIDSPIGVTQETEEAAIAGLRYAVYHWAFHPWAIFSLTGLAIAFAQYRSGQPALVSSAFYPLLGEQTKGWGGKSIDILAIIATATGVATTFGLSAMQISGGISHLTSIPNTTITQLIIIGIVTVLFLFSAASGLDKGIKILSVINMTIAGLLLIIVMLMGPTLFILENIVTTIGGYLTQFVSMSLTMTPFSESSWLGNNTIFFWAWHISWAPFMGLFIARISKGRTIREFVTGVLIVPSVLAAIWFSAFGGTALYMERILGIDISSSVFASVELALFTVLSELPFSSVLSFVAVLLILIFFVTSADSATYVLGVLASNGNLNPKMSTRLIWGVLLAATASVLLISGGLKGLQTASIVAALPFSFIMLGMVFSLLKLLKNEYKIELEEKEEGLRTQLKEQIREEMMESKEKKQVV